MPWAAWFTALSSSSLTTVNSVWPSATASPSDTSTSPTMPSTSGVALTDATGCRLPDADTVSTNVPCSTKPVCGAMSCSALAAWSAAYHANAPPATASTATAETAPMMILRFALRSLNARMSASASASTRSVGPGRPSIGSNAMRSKAF